MTANRASGTEIDRQLPVGERNLSRSRRPFRPRRGGRQPGAGARGLCADARSRCSAIPTARRPEPATSPRCSAAAISRCCSRPPTRRSAASSMRRWRATPACISPRSRLPTRKAQHRRLTEAGFAMRPLVQFQRPVDTVSGPGVAAFTVVRLERGAMAEGRIQMLAHRTEDTVWQKRWLTHPQWRAGADRSGGGQRRRRGGGGPLRALHRPQGASRRHSARRRSRSIAARCSCSPRPRSRRCFRRSRSRGCRSSAPMRSGCNRSPRPRPCCNRKRMADAPDRRGAGRAVSRRAWHRRMAVRRECRRSALAKLKEPAMELTGSSH